MLAEYDRALVSLALYLGACLVTATGDLPHALAGELHRRFVGWLRQLEAPRVGSGVAQYDREEMPAAALAGPWDGFAVRRNG